MHRTKILAEFEFGGHNPTPGVRTPKFGVRLRRWENQHRLSSFKVIFKMILFHMQPRFNIYSHMDYTLHDSEAEKESNVFGLSVRVCVCMCVRAITVSYTMFGVVVAFFWGGRQRRKSVMKTEAHGGASQHHQRCRTESFLLQRNTGSLREKLTLWVRHSAHHATQGKSENSEAFLGTLRPKCPEYRGSYRTSPGWLSFSCTDWQKKTKSSFVVYIRSRIPVRCEGF